MEYTLYCDESIDKGKIYGDFYGGCLIEAHDLEHVIKSLTSYKVNNHINAEMKWTKVTEAYLDKYIEFMHIFFSFVISGKIRVRIMFRDMRKPYTYPYANNKYLKLYYQFIKHAFGFRFTQDMPEFNLRIYLDQLPQKHEEITKFKEFLTNMPNTIDFQGCALRISKEQIAEIKSHEHVLLQCVDIVMGAMQFRLNKQNENKPEGQNHRGKRTIAKEKLYKSILHEICKIHPKFNISISTGARGYQNPHWESPYEHWLFEAYEKVSYIDLYFQQKRERERKKELNFQKLREISMLGENWNGYGAKPFSPELIIKMCRILNNLHIQPEIFPTALGSIQLEYEKDNGDYLEFQITEEDKCSVFESLSNGVQKNFIIPVSNINEVVDEFHE